MIDEIYDYRITSLPATHISKKLNKLSAEFESLLTEEQVKMFHELCDMQGACTADEMRTAYKAGFKDGVALMAEVIAP